MENKILILTACAEKEHATWSELLELTRVTKPTLYQHLEELAAKGFIRKDQQGCYAITEEGRKHLNEQLELEAAKTQHDSDFLESDNDPDVYSVRSLSRFLLYDDLHPSPSGLKEIVKGAGTMGVGSLRQLKDAIRPTQSVADYCSWIVHLRMDSVDFQALQKVDAVMRALVTDGGASAKRSLARGVWGVASRFKHDDDELHFNYGAAFNRNKKLMKESFTSMLIKNWRREFVEEASKFLARNFDFQDDVQFLYVWGWLVNKRASIGWKNYSKLQPILLLGALSEASVVPFGEIENKLKSGVLSAR